MTHTRTTIDIGNLVLCDNCGADFTTSDAKGGMIFGTNGVCPNCAPELEASAIKYGETDYIRARPKDGETFRDFIVRIRNGNNLMIIDSWKK